MISITIIHIVSRRSLVADVVTHSAVMSACGRGSAWGWGLEAHR